MFYPSRRSRRRVPAESATAHTLFTSRLIIMRKFAIASLLIAGMALSGSILAQDAAPQAAPAAKPAAAAPAPASSSHHHKKNKSNNGQPKQKGSKSAKRTAKSTLPQTEASH
jgi:hypothetical protein